MKAHYYLNLLHGYAIVAVLTLLFFWSCKKEDLPVSRVTASEKSNVASDGMLVLKKGIESVSIK